MSFSVSPSPTAMDINTGSPTPPTKKRQREDSLPDSVPVISDPQRVLSNITPVEASTSSEIDESPDNVADIIAMWLDNSRINNDRNDLNESLYTVDDHLDDVQKCVKLADNLSDMVEDNVAAAILMTKIVEFLARNDQPEFLNYVFAQATYHEFVEDAVNAAGLELADGGETYSYRVAEVLLQAADSTEPAITLDEDARAQLKSIQPPAKRQRVRED